MIPRLLPLIAAGLSAASAFASEVQPLERQLRQRFPSVVLEACASIESVEQIVGGVVVGGMRTRDSQIRVFYPSEYSDGFMAEVGEQRVVLRAVGGHYARAVESDGKLFYVNAHDSVDVVEVPGIGRSEELLVLQDERAPRAFEYEIVEMRGVSRIVVQDGAVRFIPEHVPDRQSGHFTAPSRALQIDHPWVVDATGMHLEDAASWSIVEGHPQKIRLTVGSDSLKYPIVVDPSFSATGSMGSPRRLHTATLLPNGKVLIAGGDSGASLDSAELYDPATGTFSTVTAVMKAARAEHTATLLPNGTVLIVGGQSSGGRVNTAELYDPSTQTFTFTGSMPVVRKGHTATLLPNGKVLIAGGVSSTAFLASAELYDPASGTFSDTGSMAAARTYHTATLLANGKVLIAGGSGGAVLGTTELYNPSAGTFSGAAAMTPRVNHTATLLPTGNVLVTGGSPETNTAEVYDSAANTFTATGSMHDARYSHTATLLSNGKVIVTGGSNSSGTLNTAEVFDTGTFTSTSNMTTTRDLHTATLLPSGRLLLTGGEDRDLAEIRNTAELYDLGGGTFPITGSLSARRGAHAAALLANGKVLIAGGNDGGGDLDTAELFDGTSSPGTVSPTGNLTSRRGQWPTATLLPNGKVLVAGGHDAAYLNTAYLNTADLYDPSGMGTFSATGNMTTPRSLHTATLLPNGKVLLAGGYIVGTTPTDQAEIYDPASGTFSATGNMTTPHGSHAATLLPNGKVLITGGYNGAAYTDVAELYDPASGTFSATGTMTTRRRDHTATLLPNGKVLIAGGFTGMQYTDVAELYSPSGGTFSATGSMTTQRGGHTATLLLNGKVLIVSGYNYTYPNTAELYDPPSGTFAATGNTERGHGNDHTATLLPNGRVFIAGGYGFTNLTELYDVGLGYSDARRPLVSSLGSYLCQPANLSLGGSLFTGDSEGSSGTTGSSAANSPLLRIQRVDSQQVFFATPQSFSANSYFSTTVSNLPSGHYRASIISNAVPSVEKIIEVATTPLLGTYPTMSVNTPGTVAVAPSSLPMGYNGAFYPISAVASGGFTGSLAVNGSTGVVSINNAGPVGTYTVTVSAPTNCGSPTTTFTLNVLGPPDAVTATGGTPQSALVNTAFASQLQATVKDSAAHPLSNVTVTFTAPGAGASATFSNGTAITNASGVASITATANGVVGSYNATAQVGALTATFALTNTPGTPTNVVANANGPMSVQITWTAAAGVTSYEIARSSDGVNYTSLSMSATSPFTDTVSANTAYLYKVRANAPLVGPYSAPDLANTVMFTNPVTVGGIIKAIDFLDTRAAIDAVRAMKSLGAYPYTESVAQGSIIKRIHLTEMRTALEQARSALSLPAITYAHPTITAGTSVAYAIDLNDLRNGAR